MRPRVAHRDAAVSNALPSLSNLSSLRAGAGQTAAPRRLQKPTPPGVSRTSAGQQAPDGSPSEIRDRLPMIGSGSSELAQAAFPRRSQSPRSERPLVRARTTAFVPALAHTGRSQRRRCDRPDAAARAPQRACASAHQQARVDAAADECFARPAVAELTMPMATLESPHPSLVEATNTIGSAQTRASGAAHCRSAGTGVQFEFVGESRAQLEEGAALRVHSPRARREVEDGSTGLAGAVAVPRAVVVELEAGGAVVVKSGRQRVAYATEVKGRWAAPAFRSTASERVVNVVGAR